VASRAGGALSASGEPCGRSAVGKTDFCITHGGGRRCQHVDEASGEPCGRSAVGKTDFCKTRGGGRRRKHVDEAGEPCGSSAKGKTDFARIILPFKDKIACVLKLVKRPSMKAKPISVDYNGAACSFNTGLFAHTALQRAAWGEGEEALLWLPWFAAALAKLKQRHAGGEPSYGRKLK
jgi:hypothetical protein